MSIVDPMRLLFNRYVGVVFVSLVAMVSSYRLFGPATCEIRSVPSPSEGYSQNWAPAANSQTPARRPTIQPPVEFATGEKIAFLGNSQAERMNLFGNFETLLHLRFPQKQLVIRNFARPAEEVGIQQRSTDYTALDDPQRVFLADTYICFFGFNESFAGIEGLAKFKQTYRDYLQQTSQRYQRGPQSPAPRFILVSPIAFESSGDPLLPEGTSHNENLKLYSQAIAELANELGHPFVELFESTAKLFTADPGLQYTINGCHLNAAGDYEIARLMESQLFSKPLEIEPTAPQFIQLNRAVNDKSWVHLQDYRMLNGWYVYGGRRTWDTETFPQEYKKIRQMAAVRDRYVWDIAQLKPVPPQPDDSQTGQLDVPETRFGNPGQDYSEAEELRYLQPAELIAETQVPPGFKLELFADETMFPEIAKPVQLNFDNRGRLWIACMPTYPQWKPGDPKANDKLVILEDTNQDGLADKSTVFYEELHCPTGFEFWNGGVLVVDQPRLLFLKDTDGDDKADMIVHLMDGWASDDTHHSCGAFEWSHTGQLHMLEGIATSTTLETPWGPHRSQGAGGAYVMDPRSLKIRQFALPGQYNMWCYVFNKWGQGIVGDGTTANHAWDTPLSGAQFGGRMGLNFVFNNEGMRPALGCEFLVSRHFPDDVQGQFTYACVINMNGLPRFSIGDDGGGYQGARLKHADGSPDDLIRSNDKHFRPGDPQIGPDGALWIIDWANALIGHMQYSQRDPNRDHVRGRVYRLVCADRPLVKPATQYGKSVPELLEQLREYEWRTHYRVRRELRDRSPTEVLTAVADWVSKLSTNDPDYDRLCCEALWLQASFHQIDAKLLEQVITMAKSPDARAAATRVAADFRDSVPNAEQLVIAAARDSHPRVQTEAARGLSMMPTAAAMMELFALTSQPADYWRDYTLLHALGANQSLWVGDYLAGKMPGNPQRAAEMVNRLLAASQTGAAAIPHLQVLLAQETRPEEERNKAMTALSELTGDANRGREVFTRNCIACHRVGSEDGRDYGPNIAGVGKRLTRVKLVESIIDPNAEIAEKYRSTLIATVDGLVYNGLVVAENDNEVELFDGKETKKILKEDIEDRKIQRQSSMPEGTAGMLAPAEFVDLLEYLAAQQQETTGGQ